MLSPHHVVQEDDKVGLGAAVGEEGFEEGFEGLLELTGSARVLQGGLRGANTRRSNVLGLGDDGNSGNDDGNSGKFESEGGNPFDLLQLEEALLPYMDT